MKRQFLLLEALSQANKSVRLIIAGPPDSVADGDKLREILVRFGLEDRCRLDLRFLPRATYADYVKNAAAVAYLPDDEDSLGYVAMEAAMAGKALITSKDSGGILGLVKHQKTGWVVEPNSASVAEAMTSVYRNAALTNEFGIAAKKLWLSYRINWKNTVKTLLR
jgi:glycosyltransferase involved in cell wall biosynthesis